MSAIDYIKKFSPTHIVSIVMESVTLLGINLIPYFYAHPISNTAYIAVNSIGLVAMSYSIMKVGVSASGLTIDKGNNS